jgi:hypothetical protein
MENLAFGTIPALGNVTNAKVILFNVRVPKRRGYRVDYGNLSE